MSSTSSASTRTSTKLTSDGYGSAPTATSASVRYSRASATSRRRARTHVVAHAQRRAPGGERHAVHVERLIHGAEVSGERPVGDRAAEAKPGEAEELREAAQDDQRPPVDDVPLTPEPPIGREEVHVGLVGDDHTPLGQRIEEHLPFPTLERGSGRIVRIADPDELRVHFACLRDQRLEIDATCAHRRFVHDGATRDGDHSVEVEGEGRLNHGVARLQKGRRDRSDERLRTVPWHDTARGHPERVSDVCPEVVVRLDRVARDVRQLAPERVEHAGQRPERALVPVELGCLLVRGQHPDRPDGRLDVQRLERAHSGSNELAPVDHLLRRRAASGRRARPS